MIVEYNNLNEIEKYVRNELSHTYFFEVRKKRFLIKLLHELQVINQFNVIFDKKKEVVFTNKQIEVFLARFTLGNISFEIAFNVNAVYDYLIKNNYKILRVNAEIFQSHFSKKDVNNLLDEHKKNEIVMNCFDNYFDYKINMPIIAFGSLNNGKFYGIVINGNHRIAEILASNKRVVDMYLIDCLDCIPDTFFLNNDYKKLLCVINKLKLLIQ